MLDRRVSTKSVQDLAPNLGWGGFPGRFPRLKTHGVTPKGAKTTSSCIGGDPELKPRSSYTCLVLEEATKSRAGSKTQVFASASRQQPGFRLKSLVLLPKTV